VIPAKASIAPALVAVVGIHNNNNNNAPPTGNVLGVVTITLLPLLPLAVAIIIPPPVLPAAVTAQGDIQGIIIHHTINQEGEYMQHNIIVVPVVAGTVVVVIWQVPLATAAPPLMAALAIILVIHATHAAILGIHGEAVAVVLTLVEAAEGAMQAILRIAEGTIPAISSISSISSMRAIRRRSVKCSAFTEEEDPPVLLLKGKDPATLVINLDKMPRAEAAVDRRHFHHPCHQNENTIIHADSRDTNTIGRIVPIISAIKRN